MKFALTRNHSIENIQISKNKKKTHTSHNMKLPLSSKIRRYNLVCLYVFNIINKQRNRRRIWQISQTSALLYAADERKRTKLIFYFLINFS